jgi:hypothetical protein
MNALLPKFQTCLVRTYDAGFHPRYWSFVDKQIIFYDGVRLINGWMIGEENSE